MLFDPLLNTTGGSTGSQSHSSNDSMQSYHTTPPKVLTPSPRIPEPTIPPTPYVNQAVVEQHTRVQLPPVPPRNTATVAAPPQESPETSVAQESLITLTTPQQAPPQVQEQMTRPSHQPKKSKSKDGQGVKQSRNNKTTDGAPVCWRCGEPGHQKRDCRKPPFCGKCRKEGHVPALCPLSKGPTQPSPPHQQLTSSPIQQTDAYALEESTHQPVVQRCTSLKPRLVHLAMNHQNEVQELANLHRGVRHRHYLSIMSRRDR